MYGCLRRHHFSAFSHLSHHSCHDTITSDLSGPLVRGNKESVCWIYFASLLPLLLFSITRLGRFYYFPLSSSLTSKLSVSLCLITHNQLPTIKLSTLFPVAAWCIWGPKVKIDYLFLDAKLLLINVNYVEFFLFFRNFTNRKNLTKFFILVIW